MSLARVGIEVDVSGDARLMVGALLDPSIPALAVVGGKMAGLRVEVVVEGAVGKSVGRGEYPRLEVDARPPWTCLCNIYSTLVAWCTNRSRDGYSYIST